jgi:hypothetical protein
MSVSTGARHLQMALLPQSKLDRGLNARFGEVLRLQIKGFGTTPPCANCKQWGEATCIWPLP